MKIPRFGFFVAVLILYCDFAFPQIVINEFMASNDSTISDTAGEYDDWLELINASSDSLNLFGWYISDNVSNPTKHQFLDSIIIHPESIILLWADDDEEQGSDHLSFKLGASGEEIILTNPAQEVIDLVYFDQQQTDVSFGRYPNYSGDWGFMNTPTPGELNTPHDTSQFTQYEIAAFPESGVYSDPIFVSLDVNLEIIDVYYTSDGSIPDTSSNQYLEPILLNETTTLRVIAIESGLLPSRVQTHHFILNTEIQLPVMALAIEPGSFPIDNQEYNTHVTYIDQNGSLGFRADAGIETHGTASPQNPYRISFKTEYGTSFIDYPIFDDRTYHRFKRLILRNASNDRFPYNNNGNRAHLRDGIIHTLYKHLHPNSGYSSFQSLHVYINNSYWGIYHLRERQDKFYVEDLFGYEDVDLLERAFNYTGNKNAIEGDWLAYDALENFVETQDMSQVENFEYLKDNIHYDEFLDYWILEVFVGNYDWLSNNVKLFRPRSGEDKWRWLLWDVDHGLGRELSAVGVDWGDPAKDYLDWSTGFEGDRTWNGENNRIIRAILRNDQGRIDFINRFSDLLNTDFLSETIIGTIDSLANIISPDMYFHADRWGGQLTDWDNGVETVRDYARERPPHVREHIKDKFDLDTTYQVTLEILPYYLGSIQINSISVNNLPWTGSYFSNVPIVITANPLPGYEVLQWEGTGITSNTIILDSLVSDTTFTVRVGPVSNHSLVINEFLAINNGDWVDEYGEADDFLELYNGTDSTITLNGMRITDDPTDLDNMFTFSDTALWLLPPGEFMTFWADNETWQGANHLNFKLDGDGEQIYLFNELGTSVLDSIIFNEQQSNISFGRYTDGSFNWIEMYPTFGSENIGSVPIIDVSTDSVNFLSVHPHDTAEVSFELTNVGLTDLVVSELHITDTAVHADFQLPITIEPGASDSLSLIYLPRNPGTLDAHAFLRTNDPTQTSVNLYLQGSSQLASHAILFEISDVPDDEGLRVELGFLRSRFDGIDTSNTVDEYVVWRYDTMTAMWDSVNAVTANEDSVYFIEASTFCNSTANDACFASFKVSTRLHDSDSLIWSNARAGYSIDNLAPSAPLGLAADFDDVMILSWTPNHEQDVVDYFLDVSDDSLFIADQYYSFAISDTFFIDSSYQTGSTVHYRLSAADYTGNVSGYSDTLSIRIDPTTADNIVSPAEYMLYPSYPNPFNPITTILYEIPEETTISLDIYNLRGQHITTLSHGDQQAGRYKRIWDGRDTSGKLVATGIYFARFSAGDYTKTVKMLYLK